MQLAQPTAAVARCRPLEWRCATLAPVLRALRVKSTGPVSVSDNDILGNIVGCVGFWAVCYLGLCGILGCVLSWAVWDFGLCRIWGCAGFLAVWDFELYGILSCVGLCNDMRHRVHDRLALVLCAA